MSFQRKSQVFLLISLVLLLAISKVASQRKQPLLAATTGISPEILKQLPIKKQTPINNLQATMKGGVSNQTKAVQSASMIFLVNKESTGIEAVDKATGEVAWFKQYSNIGWKGAINKIQSTPCYNEGTDVLYFVAPDLNLYGYNAGTGTQIFKFQVRLDDYFFTPVCSGNVVAFTVYNNATRNTEYSGFYGGEEIPVGKRGRMAYNITVEKNFGRIQQYGKRAYFVQNPWDNEALAGAQNVSYLTISGIEDGLITYNRSVGATMTSSPYWVADNEVYFGAADAESNKWIYRWDLRSTDVVWKFDLQPQGTTRLDKTLTYPALDSIPVVDEKYVYVPTRYGELYALDRETGEPVWNITKEAMTQAKDSRAIIIQNQIVIGSDKDAIFVVNKNLTTFSYIKETKGDIINTLQDGNTVYYVDSEGGVNSIFIDYDIEYEPIFRQNHRYFDMKNVTFRGSLYQGYDNFSSDQSFDQFFVYGKVPASGFNSYQSIRNIKEDTQEVMFGSLDYSIYNLANVSNYAHYLKFNRTTKAPIVATGEINERNQSAYVGSLDNVVYAVGIDNYQYWYHNTFAPILSQPVLSNNVLYTASSDGTFYAIDPIRSKLDEISHIFNISYDDWTTSTPLVAGDRIFLGSTSGRIFAIDTTRGTSDEIAKMEGRIFGDGSVDNLGYIYYGDQLGNVAKFGADGKLQWTKLLNGPIYGSVTVRNSTVAVGTMEGSFYLLNTRDGEQMGVFEGLGSLMSNVVNYNETFYVGSLDGWMYAFNSTDNTILNANQIDAVKNITAIGTTKNFQKDRLLYITTSKLIDDPKGGFIVDAKTNSTVYAVTPPGATKKYTPIDYLGPIVPIQDYQELAAQNVFVGPPSVGIDFLKVPTVNQITQQNTFDLQGVFTASTCAECSDALGRDVGKWIMGTLFSLEGIDSQYISTQCSQTTNNCFRQRRLLQNQYNIPLTIRLAVQNSDPQKVQKTLQGQGNNVTSSQTLTNYGGQNFQVQSINQAPVETVWKKNERYFIVAIVVGGVVILIIITLCIQAHCRKPNQRRFKKMLKNVGPLGPVMLQGNKIQQNKPLLQTDDNDNQSRPRSDNPQSDTLQEEDLEDNDSESNGRYERNQRHYNEPPNYKL